MRTTDVGDVLQAFQRAGDADALISAFDDLAVARGALGFVSTSHARPNRADVLLYTSMRDVFAPLDEAGDWWNDDPPTDRLQSGALQPFDFDFDLMSEGGNAAERYAVMYESGFGLGRVLPCSGGGQFGGVLVFADTEPGGKEEVGAAEPFLHMAAALMHGFVLSFAPEAAPESSGVIRNRLSPALASPDAPADTRHQALAPREIDCLSWCAMGKTAEETAIILGLSVHTVRHYLRTATAKLGARTQAQAVALALQSGQVRL